MKSVLFELDGTLTDSREGIVRWLEDALLRRGRRVYGIAVDDMHALPGGLNNNVPGGGFVMIYARPDWIDVRQALTEGRFYASSGPVLRELHLSAGRLSAVPADTRDCHWRLHGNEATMRKAGPLRLARPSSGYLRAVYDCGDSGRVFLQPLMGK